MRYAWLLIGLLTAGLLGTMVCAEEMPFMPKPDDQVNLSLSAEGWATTKTARVTVTVNAAVSGSNAGSMRAEMMKAVNELAKADWRLTGFARSNDQTGLERWSANFETRMPEADLGGLNDAAKKASKAGMQLTVADVDFSPTLDEVQAVHATLRGQIYKDAADQLQALNAALPGRNYRISVINFNNPMSEVPMMLKGRMGMNVMAAAASDAQPAPAPMERAEKVTETAQIIFAASAAPSPAVPPSASAPVPEKH